MKLYGPPRSVKPAMPVARHASGKPPAWRGAVFVRGGKCPVRASGCPASRGWLPLPPPHKARGRSAKRRYLLSVLPRPSFRGTRAPLGAPLWRLLAPGSVLPGGDRARSPLIQAALAALRPSPVQPLKAAGRSAGGRQAGASRARGNVPRPRAPPLLPFLKRPAGTPLGGEGARNISLLIGAVKREK